MPVPMLLAHPISTPNPLNIFTCSERERSLEKPAPNPPKHHNNPDQHARKLEYRHFIPALRHARQTPRAALERRAEGGECFGLQRANISAYSSRWELGYGMGERKGEE